MKSKIWIGFAAFLLLLASVGAWTPTSDIDLRDYYDLIGGIWINATNFTASGYFIGDGSLLTNVLVTGNTSAEIIAAVNVTEAYEFTSKNSTQVFNDSYDAQLGHNTTAEIRAAVDADTNATTACGWYHFLDGGAGCLGYLDGWNRTDQGNSSTEMIEAVNTTGNYQINASTAGTANNAGLLDNYDSGHFYPVNKTGENATIFGDDVMVLFGTDSDVAMYFNGSHFVIEST